MTVCEKCWADAYGLASKKGTRVVDEYADLLFERRDNPCSQEEQRGEGLISGEPFVQVRWKEQRPRGEK